MLAPRSTLPALAVASLLLLPQAAGALGPDDVVAGVPVEPSWWVPEVTDPTRPETLELFHVPGVVFINFDGGQMQSCGGSNDPVDNCSTIMSDMVRPYSGGASSRAAVIQAFSADVADFQVEVTDQRPADDVDYDMNMVGDWDPPPDDGGFAGVAPTIDCWNRNRGETSFTLDVGGSSTVAKVVGQEVAHVWGLEHVDSASDLLFPTTGGASNPSFENQCHQIVVLDMGISPTDSVCQDMHEVNCPDQEDHQNSYMDLLMVFGPSTPDTTPPTVEILAPAEGESFASGASFDLVVRTSDNIPPPYVDLYLSVDADEMGTYDKQYKEGEHVFPVSGLPDGDHMIRVDGLDVDGNATVARVNFTIGGSGGGDGDTGGDDGGTGNDDGGDGGGDDGGDGGGDGGDGGGGDGGGGDDGGDGDASGGDNGCGCRTVSDPATPLVAMLVIVLARSRRSLRR